jgi:hypothetical protein
MKGLICTVYPNLFCSIARLLFTSHIRFLNILNSPDWANMPMDPKDLRTDLLVNPHCICQVLIWFQKYDLLPLEDAGPVHSMGLTQQA